MLTSYALLFTIAAIGISETSYLISKRNAKERPICVIGERCNEVLSSKYSAIFGVPNDVLGLLFYISLTLVTAFLVIGLRPMELWDIIGKLLIAGGVAMSLGLLFLQWKVIRAWCFWCVMSAITTFLMAAIVLTI